MRVGIYGAGGHGKVVWEILVASGHTVVGFVDDGKAGEVLLDVPVVSSVADLPPFDGLIVAIGNNEVRRRLFDVLRTEGHALVNAIHPSAIISPRATLGAGVMVVAGVIVNIHATIGDNVILNTGATVDHDCWIMSHTHIAPGTHLGGNVQVGEGAFLGLGTRVTPGVTVGNWATCGAGAVVIRDVPPSRTVVGVPARPLSGK